VGKAHLAGLARVLVIKMAMFVLMKIKPTGQLYETESEPGDPGSAECSTLLISITH